MKPGDTFIASEHPRILAHLWLILSDPRQDPTHVVLANLTNTRTLNEAILRALKSLRRPQADPEP